MATYQGSPFEAGIGPTDGDIVLFAACPPPESLRFEPATGHWRKQLRLGDVQAVWESRPVGRFRGERCMVLDDLGDRLHIGYLGHDGYKAEQLGYWQVDRGVFELVAPRAEVTDILEERAEYRRPASSTEHGPAGHLPPRPYDSAAYRIPTMNASAGSAMPAAAPEAGGYVAPTVLPEPSGYADATEQPAAAYSWQPAPDGTTGVTLPAATEAPLPLEAEALRAASASRRPRRAPAAPAEPQADTARAKPAPARQRRATRRRMATEQLFADLADLAGIPADAYSIGEDVEGALCLIQLGDQFEVYHSAGGAQHELQIFPTEESACFYLFGVLAAEAVRNGTLGRVQTAVHASTAG
ncbi:MAG TPA: hypothetical protein VMA32_14630 [Streptosporangiaceae bacterium]|nr:hypothetical protein [Streptosporangiaceae bacterium]